MQLRRVPIALTSGWGGAEDFARSLHSGALLAHRAVFAQLHRLKTDVVAHRSRHERQSIDAYDLIYDMEQAPLQRRASVEAPATLYPQAREIAPRPPEMDELVTLQQADGSWELTAELAAILKRDPREIEAALAGAVGSPLSVRRAWATALALAWLQLRAADQHDEWKLLGAKAQKWIGDVNAVPPGGWTWIDAARGFLERSA